MGTREVTFCDACDEQSTEENPVTEDFRISTVKQEDGRGVTSAIVQFHKSCTTPMFKAIADQQAAKKVSTRGEAGSPADDALR